MTGELADLADVAAGEVEGAGDGVVTEAVGADGAGEAGGNAEAGDQAANGFSGESGDGGVWLAVVEPREDRAGTLTTIDEPRLQGRPGRFGESQPGALSRTLGEDGDAGAVEVDVDQVEAEGLEAAEAEIVEEADQGEVATAEGSGGAFDGGCEECSPTVVAGAACVAVGKRGGGVDLK